MTTRITALWTKFKSRKYRESFVESHLSSTVAAQIQTMRHDRSMTQADLAALSGMKQSRISVLEDPDNKSLSIATLRRIAAAFDVALVIRFVPFSAVARWSSETGNSKFSVASFSDERAPVALPLVASAGTSDYRPYRAEAAVTTVAATRKFIRTSDRAMH